MKYWYKNFEIEINLKEGEATLINCNGVSVVIDTMQCVTNCQAFKFSVQTIEDQYNFELGEWE